MRKFTLCVVLFVYVIATGCSGSKKTEIIDRQWTDEEKAKIKAEDTLVDQEESQGKTKPGKKKK